MLFFIILKRKMQWTLMAACLLASATAQAQLTLPLTDLSFFKAPAANWQLAGDVWADLNQSNLLTVKNGTGILVNLVSKTKHGEDLFTSIEHGDMDLELDYLMAKGSNSGIYLQGRYEVQLLDSWGIAIPKAVDNGAIYDRNAPRQNVSRAPGLWQHLKISFQAPRFDANGRKTDNAKMLRIELNGVLIHEGISLAGPTGGAMGDNEVANGPLRIQGDHGTVAFKNISITKYDKARPGLSNLHYTVYEGKFNEEPDFSELIPKFEGSAEMISSNMVQLKNEFLVRYTGKLQVNEAGEYAFNLSTPGGKGFLKINDKTVIPMDQSDGEGKITLPAGSMPFELAYAKFEDWAQPALGLSVAGPGIREYSASDANTPGGDVVDPILVNATNNTLLHSFMDIPGQRIVHAVSVGSPTKLHYTYDMEKGNLVQVWRGGFLDATPMWHERGDGSSRPAGSVVLFGTSSFFLQKLSSQQQAWSTDSAGTGYRPKGYQLDKEDRPAFRYQLYGSNVVDAMVALENGQGIKREITVKGPAQNLHALLARGKNIELLPGGLYIIDDKAYYIQVNDNGGAQPILRTSGGQQELLLPVKEKITYTILF
ncbi:3-keto-disaccharide hydrolase [Flavihumibacter fluvii]|uniref:3-keto-disaccharide hydrolase n=1 Tax=Flavihumibacter fluvii TaxID=2838157 RepID=UPI001BDE553C|nr:DUF1080 domain-containing protein [Flavihumibacter fluvii]ULQ51174.1 DUF1080 domain-containing protein [Flavihumibacter fluvii]